MSKRQFTPSKPALGTPFSPVSRPLLQRKCACGGTPGPTGECKACRSKRLQRAASHQSALSPQSAAVPPIVHDVLRASGHPLDGATRAFMGARFGHDFSRVRLHTDARAAESARAVDALAYTVGSEVVFGEGQYAPGTREGRRLLAHELTHVVQQQAGSPLQLQTSDAGGPFSTFGSERDSGEIAEAVKESRQESEFAREGSVKLFRQPKEKKGDTKAPSKKEKKKEAASTKLTANEVKALIVKNNKSTLSTELLLCQIWKESSFDQKEKTGTHLGLFQMDKAAVKQLNISSPKGVHCDYSKMYDAAENIRCGTIYLAIRIGWAKGDVTKGLEGFGTGTGYATNIQTCEACVKKTPEKTDDCLGAIHP